MSCEEELGLFSLRKTQEIEIVSRGKYEVSDSGDRNHFQGKV